MLKVSTPGQMMPTTKLGRVRQESHEKPATPVGRYAEVPNPRQKPPQRDTEATQIVQPDDLSLDEWAKEWSEEFRVLQARMIDKVRSVMATGRQGTLGLTREADERTPAQAVAYLAREVVRQRGELEAMGAPLASIIGALQARENLGGE